MVDLTKNKITQMIEEKVGDYSAFDNTVLVCNNNSYVVEQIELLPSTLNIYKNDLETRCKSGVLKRSIDCNKRENTKFVLEYSRDIQLMNGKNAHMKISWHCDDGNNEQKSNRKILCHCDYISIKIGYEDENINLYQDRMLAEQLAVETILPELDNVLFIIDNTYYMNKGISKAKANRKEESEK